MSKKPDPPLPPTNEVENILISQTTSKKVLDPIEPATQEVM